MNAMLQNWIISVQIQETLLIKQKETDKVTTLVRSLPLFKRKETGGRLKLIYC